jgi:Dolichyl-phosphate-mannose-protein mannosyltransferase
LNTRASKSPRSARRSGSASSASLARGSASDVVTTDPDAVNPATRQETFPIALGAVLLSFIALLISYSRGYLLLYGDAVAHLGIARRILDSRNPGIVQLGGVWLPLPHLLMLPFVQKIEWWQNGLAGAWPSLVCYIASVAGLYRLARRMMVPRWALAATALYALNPNLLYLSTTAMTEPLFLALLIWITLLTAECVSAVHAARYAQVGRRLLLLALFLPAAVYTRYDGWILGAAAWCVLTFTLVRRGDVWRRVAPSFVVFTLLTVAAPLSWLAYNQHFFHDPLDFMRGPYSAAAIEKKTMPPNGQHHRGWHNPLWALVFYTRTAQIDAAFWEIGFLLMAAAVTGMVLAIRRRLALASLLLWMPLPFYIYSIAYGSVPIFIPQLWPHSYYNSRYGMELLPALSIFTFLAVAWIETRWSETQPLAKRLMQPIALLLVALNTVGMMYSTPLVLKEALANSTTRIAFETALARQLRAFPDGATILMYNSDHVGALQAAAMPLKQTINEGDYDSFQAALAAPAEHATYIVAIAGDPVAAAVATHPQGLTELTILCTSGQPCARIYRSDQTISNPPKL